MITVACIDKGDTVLPGICAAMPSAATVYTEKE
jgi:hypothetical protein